MKKLLFNVPTIARRLYAESNAVLVGLSLLALLAEVLLCDPCVAQRSRKDVQDVVYLKNGSVIRGVRLYSRPAVVKIKTEDGNLFVFDSSSVDTITVEDFYHSPTTRPLDIGPLTHLQFGLTSNADDGGLGAGLGFTYGVYVSEAFSISGGLGYDYYDYRFSGLPLFVDARLFFSEGSFAPYLVNRAGVVKGLGLSGNGEWGSILSSGIGLRVPALNESGTTFELAVKLSSISRYRPTFWQFAAGYIL